MDQIDWGGLNETKIDLTGPTGQSRPKCTEWDPSGLTGPK